MADENLANGVHYTEEDITNYCEEDGHRVRFNHLVVDPSEKSLEIISAKAKETVNAMETIGDQAQREILKGNHVVAAINADSYDMDYGISRGIVVKDGCNLIIARTIRTCCHEKTNRAVLSNYSPFRLSLSFMTIRN